MEILKCQINEIKAGQPLSHKATYIKDSVMTVAKFIYLGLCVFKHNFLSFSERYFQDVFWLVLSS